MEQVPNSKKLIESKMATLIEQMQALPKNPRGFPKDKKKHASLQKQLDTLSGQLKKLQKKEAPPQPPRAVTPESKARAAALLKKKQKELEERKEAVRKEKKKKKVVKKPDIPLVVTRPSSASKKKVVKKEKKSPKAEVKKSKVISTKGQKPPIRTKVEKKTDSVPSGKLSVADSRRARGVPAQFPRLKDKTGKPTVASMVPEPWERRNVGESGTPEQRSKIYNEMFKPGVRMEGATTEISPSTSSAKPSPRVPETSEKNQRNVAEKKKEVDEKAIKRVTESNKDTDIFHQIAYGIGKITGQPATLDYTYPGDSDYNKRKGGKVSNPSRKKYAMNRGGKVASIRKPTRA